MKAGRVVLAKPGLDGHDRGVKVIAMALRDAGAEVDLPGTCVGASPRLVRAAADDDADVIGISVLSGAHLELTRDLLRERDARGLREISIVLGGTIAAADVDELRGARCGRRLPGRDELLDVVEGVLRLAVVPGDGLIGDRTHPVTTDSGLPVEAVYTAADVAEGLEGRRGMPGEALFTRGPYLTMYRGQLWTMRQFDGFGSSEETNAGTDSSWSAGRRRSRWPSICRPSSATTRRMSRRARRWAALASRSTPRTTWWRSSTVWRSAMSP